METKSLFRNGIKLASFIMVFLWTSMNVMAQCPTISDPTPPAVCDASGFTIDDLNAYATDPGGGIVWYNAETDGTAYRPNELLLDGIYYIDDNAGSCPSPRQSITITFQVNTVPSGVSLDKFYCSNENATIQDYIDDTLTPYIPSGVNIFYDVDLTNQANTTDIISEGFVNYYIVFTDGGGCASQINFGTTIVSVSPADPTPANPQVLCSDTNPTIADLDPGTTAAFSWYQNVDGSEDPVPPALPASQLLVDGSTYYVQIDDVFCDSNAVPVTVNIDNPNDPGASANLDYCTDNVPAGFFNLYDELGGTADTTGSWSGPLTTSNGHLGTVDISTLTTPGTYTFTYTVPDNGACPASNSSVTVVIYDIFSSGILSVNNPASFCEATLPTSFDLFTLIENYDPDGQWIEGTTSSGIIVADPMSLNLTGYTPATYNFTYTQNSLPNPCPEESTTVQVIVLADPNAGTALNAVFCENDLAAKSPFNLFDALDGSQDNNSGTWTDSSNATISNTIDITGFTVAGSPYSFDYTIDNGTCSDTETISITIEPAPESGTVNAPVAFCIADITTDQTYDLYDLLTDEDQTGSWNDDDGSTALSGNLVTIDGLPEGTYNFTYDVAAIDTCDDVIVTVSIIINDTPAPAAAATQMFCNSALISDLSVTGNTIIWYDAPTGGNALIGTTALADGQVYYATQTDATTGCESSNRTAVSVTIYQSPNAGNISTSPIAACNDNVSIDLNDGLDGTQDSGGQWQNDDSVGTLMGNIFNATGLPAGAYNFTYLLTASAPCLDASTTISVIIEEPLNAGTDGAPLDLCSNDGTIDLFTQLGGTPETGGTWSPALVSTTGVFDPLVDAPGTYTYSLTNACGTASSDVAISVTLAPNAGSDNTVLICVGDGITDLFPLLGTSAQSGGVWSPALPSGTGEFDPASDAAAVYTYTVTTVSPCTTDASAQITVTVDDTPTPTVSNTNPEFCAVDNPTVSNLDSAITSTGTINWYEDAALTIVANATDDLVDGEDYYVIQTNSSGCESSQSTVVNVAINDTPTPTLANANLELCINDDPTLLELELNIVEFNASSNNIAWYDVETGGASISNNASLSNGTTYYAALIDATTGCESSVRLPITPDLTSCGKLVLPDGFSPNGDGVNDTYDIDNLQILYPNFELEIYNRYGNIVYKGTASTPQFDGTSNQSRTVVDGDLPVGVYFYIFNFNDAENKPEQGRLYLSR
ncbi:gliding motility-associated C-terminal domain-containing protein [Changchengzhania lutea]|uniref:gliding motility-associated C-terminal domain-containing protein n=1 Tax=Changchengzhania lutea TaxID=2049305 RepID=UPI00115CC26B|nr:gliding motility-associated C-terminal domain-containing protein [Changchengzhania lutea]